MSYAILHDYFDEIGGAEITLLTLAQELKATVFTTNIDRKKIAQLGFENVDIRSIGKVSSMTPFKQYVSRLRFWRLRLTGFTTYIYGGSYALFAARKHNHNVWYVNSFPVGLYENKKDGGPLTFLWRYLDNKFVKKIDTIIANSQTTGQKVQKYYDRKSETIYHPVDTSRYVYKPHKNYWLSVNRIDRYKQIELQLETFAKLPTEKLVIVGDSSRSNLRYYENLKAQATENVVFMGGVYDKDVLIGLYSECKGFIATAHNEDFGMSVVEAMASGKPVVALNEGGYSETVLDGETGMLARSDVDELVKAVQYVGEHPEDYKQACLERAKEFDSKEFIKKVREHIHHV